jgi:transposase-like protein
MKYLLCGHNKVHKHSKTEKGHQRYKCPQCSKTFPGHFDSLYYGRIPAPRKFISSANLMLKVVTFEESAGLAVGLTLG